MAIFSLRDILFTIKELLSLADKKSKNKEKITEMLIAIQIAIIETRKYITDHGYQTNIELSKVWFDAFDKAKRTNIYPGDEFPEYLYNKARFWGDPAAWLREQGALEIVPKLDQLEKECDSILVRLR